MTPPRPTFLDSEGRTHLKAWALPAVVAAICLPIAAAFLLGGAGIGLAVTAAVAMTVVVVAARSRPYGPMEVASPPDRSRRVLVLAGEEPGAASAERIADVSRDAADVRVVVPTPSSRLSRWLSAEDRARGRAQDRLARVAGSLTAAGLRVSGSVGDSDPVQAVEDELRSFAADEVIVIPAEGWQSQIERLRDKLALPLTRVQP